MRLSSLWVCPLLVSLLPSCVAQSTWNIPTYFIITTPTKGTVWSNNATNNIQWTVAVDAVPYGQFDVEMARLSTDGLLFVARNALTSWNSLNIDIEGIPNGDDYFLLFLDATNGMSYSTSQRFSIQTNNGTTPWTDSTVPTASVSGTPNPTVGFGTTFAAVATNAAARMPLLDSSKWVTSLLGVVGMMAGAYMVF